MILARITCSESEWHQLWQTAFMFAELGMAFLVGLGAHTVIKKRRDDEYGPWDFAPWQYAPIR